MSNFYKIMTMCSRVCEDSRSKDAWNVVINYAKFDL
jgi:hypothetical protein